jgi:hypothetical protein
MSRWGVVAMAISYWRYDRNHSVAQQVVWWMECPGLPAAITIKSHMGVAGSSPCTLLVQRVQYLLAGDFMNYSRYLLATAAISLAFGVAGCKHNSATAGGPGGGGTLDLTPGNAIAYSDTDTAAHKLAEGPLEASAATSSLITADTSGDQVVAGESKPGEFKIAANGNGGVDMTVNGQTVSFASGDKDPDPDTAGWKKTDGTTTTTLTSYWADDVDKVVDGTDTDYLQVWKYNVDDGDKALSGYAVVGAETPEDFVKTSASATYKGTARVDMALAEDADEQIHVKGKMTLNADFAARSVSGNVTDLRGRYSGNEYPETGWEAASGGSIDMNKATISGNGFAGGTLTQKDVEFSDNVTHGVEVNIDGSTYSGRFYGPEANQVGGIINVNGTADGTHKVIGQGYLAGTKQ